MKLGLVTAANNKINHIMSALIITVLKLLGSIVSGGLLFQAFVAHHHSSLVTKIAGIVVSIMTFLMFVIDVKEVFPDDEADKTEQIYWESVEKHPSAAAYRTYLNQYPNGKFIRLARTQIADYAELMPTAELYQAFVSTPKNLTTQDTASIEQLYWASVESHPSVELYRDYLKQYPKGRFADIARTQLNSYMKMSRAVNLPTEHVEIVDDAGNAEKIYWRSIQTHPNIELYRNYLQQYPSGQYAAIAQKQLEYNTKTQRQQRIEALQTKHDSSAGWQAIAHYQVKDGLVKDTKTGLMWMRCSLGQNWQGKSCTGAATSYSWEQAMNSFKNVDYAGYTDWRVPTREELKTLVYCSSGKTHAVGEKTLNACDDNSVSPTIVTAAFPETPAWFWSSSPYASSSSYAWYVFFGYGYDDWSYKYSDYQLRLVRNTQPVLD
ncbi:DUF1566 domain-containing protein [Crenothrix polyspora]|uniref:Lcl C-terminal domain-containing protein n=1 Tax=Crenothrix polyspora TaxID=360316 RepID=A0A1R4HET2_9GAMM|nr:DUF1566 domain-containing protein [Crenothrix polyspora]SJM94719.1 hypothetical protein CRENPOLYSF1_580021 [Crenothrix polyspora]